MYFVICLKSNPVGDNDLSVGTRFGWMNIIVFYVGLFIFIIGQAESLYVFFSCTLAL